MLAIKMYEKRSKFSTSTPLISGKIRIRDYSAIELIGTYKIDGTIVDQITDCQRVLNRLNAIWKHPAKHGLKDKLAYIFKTKSEFPPLFCQRIPTMDKISVVTGYLWAEWLKQAALLGNSELVKWFCHENHQSTRLTPDQITLNNAAESGCLELVRWLCEEKQLAPDQETLERAAISGNLKVVLWLYRKKQLTPTQETLEKAMKSGNVKLIKWLYYNTFAKKKLYISEAMYYNAVKTGNVLLVNWLHRFNTYAKNHDAMNALNCAIESGNIKLLEWLFLQNNKHCSYKRESFKVIGRLQHYQNTWSKAAKFGNLALIYWLCETAHFQPTQTTLKYAVKSGNVELITYLLKKLSPTTVEPAHINMVKQLYQRDQDNTKKQNTLDQAIRAGNVEFTLWFYKIFPQTCLSQSALWDAARKGSLDLVKWLCHTTHKVNQLIPDQETFVQAAFSGNVKLMQWLLDNAHEEPSQETLRRINHSIINTGNNNLYHFIQDYTKELAKTRQHFHHDPIHPIKVKSLHPLSSVNLNFWANGYLNFVEKLTIKQKLTANQQIRSLALKQIIDAVKFTLYEYNIIWRPSITEKTTRPSYHQLSAILDLIQNSHLDGTIKHITQFFKGDIGYWHAGTRCSVPYSVEGTYLYIARLGYEEDKGPSIKTLLMKNLLTIPLFHRKIKDDTLTLITRTEIESNFLYTLDLTQDNFGKCNINKLICFFKNEFKRLITLTQHAEHSIQQHSSKNTCQTIG